MTIHHDKLAYGKLASNVQEMTEDEILKMLEDIKEEEDDNKGQEPPKNNA